MSRAQRPGSRRDSGFRGAGPGKGGEGSREAVRPRPEGTRAAHRALWALTPTPLGSRGRAEQGPGGAQLERKGRAGGGGGAGMRALRPPPGLALGLGGWRAEEMVGGRRG